MPITEVTQKYEPKKIEKKIREFWESKKIPQKLTKLSKDKKKFYLLDGPPYVNDIPHVGHVKTTTLKDIWSKFKLMQGFSSWFQPGFDCHGLPIENKVEKELGIKSKKDIEKMGTDKFIEACKEFASGNEEKWLELYKALGAWRGYVEPYLTYKNYYIESAWWTFKQIANKGMLYRGEKPTFWCPHCQTALSGYEVTNNYVEVKDPYIYVKFPLANRENEYIVIFTTTPWTLVSNVAIAVRADQYYVKVRVGNEHLIMIENRVEPVLKELCGLEYEIEERFLGKELDGVRYLSVLEVPAQEKLKENEKARRIILSIPVLKSKSYKHGVLEEAEKMKGEFFDFVTIEEGSGAVHTAPGHGPEDYYVGQHYQLPTVSPVDDEGKFTKDAGEFEGMFVKDADEKIVERLKEKGYLLYFGWITHSYPVCWRCGSKLIYRLTKQWFFSIDQIKEKMLKANEEIKWLPEFGRERFGNWLKDAVDWCVSRQRYWGIPLPIWICDNCGNLEIIGSVQELREKAINKLPEELDLHKHVVDKIELKCSKCGGKMHRTPDILDVWFDSGISPWASLGYPYQNKDVFEQLWPVDLIDESQDQIRGWFYSLMFCGVATFDQAPYKAIAMNGWVLDEKGEKMSKSLGNVVWADEALEKVGADILRLYYCWEVAPWEQQNFSFKTAREIWRALNILWNSYSFFTTYCTEDFKPKLDKPKVEDKWLLSRINTLISEVTQHMDNFEFHLAGRKLVDFILNDLSRFYIKLIRDRVWITVSGDDKLTALSTLYKSLVDVTKLLAPVTPFISEEIYQNLVVGLDSNAPESIFQDRWPEKDERMIDKKLEDDVELVKKIIEASLYARQKANLKLRWPVKSVVIVSKDEKVKTAVENCKEILLNLCNCKDISVTLEEPEGDFSKVERDFGSVLVDRQLTDELKQEALIRELIRKVQDMRKKNGLHVKETISLSLNSDSETSKLLESYKSLIAKEVGAKEIKIKSSEGKYRGELEFRTKKIEIAFDKL